MNTQAKVGIEKRQHPERFCPHDRCLWRTGGKRCPRHAVKEVEMKKPETKMIEIRDRMTCIAAMATQLSSEHGPVARHAGYGTHALVVLTVFHSFRGEEVHSEHDPFGWDTTARTYREAHRYIERNWDSLRDGDVVDVEYVLRETSRPKEPELA